MQGLRHRVRHGDQPGALHGPVALGECLAGLGARHQGAVGFDDQGQAIATFPDLLQPGAQLGEHHVHPDHAPQGSVRSKEWSVVGDRENLRLVFPGVDRAPEGASRFGRVGVPGLLMGLGHPGDALEQRSRFSVLHRVDRH